MRSAALKSPIISLFMFGCAEPTNTHNQKNRESNMQQRDMTTSFHILPSEVLPIITKRMAFYMACKEFYVFVPAGVKGLKRPTA